MVVLACYSMILRDCFSKKTESKSQFLVISTPEDTVETIANRLLRCTTHDKILGKMHDINGELN